MRLTTLDRTATSATFTGGVLHVRIQRELTNSNSGNRNPRWYVKAKSRKNWQDVILGALMKGLGDRQTLALVGGLRSGVPHGGGLVCRCLPKPGQKTKRCHCPASMRRAVTITRFVPAARYFVRDVGNLYACLKEVLDALTGLGLIRDDADKWIDLHPPRQGVSADKRFWTDVLIEPVAPSRRELVLPRGDSPVSPC